MRNKRYPVATGSVYNKLKIVSFSHKDTRSRKWYNTICECGNTKKIMGSAMVSGNTKSCGCYSSRFQKERNLLPDNLGVKRQIILQYKRHAILRGFIFNISESDFIELLTMPCNYCGLPPSNIKKTKNFKAGFAYSGVDRLDSTGNYTNQNCVPCCNNCNKAKMAMPVKDFLSWIKRVYDHSFE
jgi:hypothetical protein